MMTSNIYQIHSKWTDPGEYQDYLMGFPMEMSALSLCLQNLLIHINDTVLYDWQPPDHRLRELDNRYVKDILKSSLSLLFQRREPAHESLPSHKNLAHEPRIPSQRVLTTCRDFALLACAVLRQHNIPSRIRFGFNSYYFKQFFHDVVLVEYWDASKQRWCLADTRIGELQIAKYQMKIQGDWLDLNNQQFQSAAQAWKNVRSGRVSALKYGTGLLKQTKGLWYIRNKLLQDLAALNKIELLPWDTWGYMLASKPGSDPDDKHELSTLDHVAEVLNAPALDVQYIHKLFQSSKQLKVPNQVISTNPYVLHEVQR